MERTLSCINRYGQRLDGILHVPRTRKRFDLCVIVCHGFRARKDVLFYTDLARAVTAIGLPVYRFDFSGNGASEGRFDSVSYTRWREDLQDVMSALERKGFDYFSLIGHSLGGGVVLLTAADDMRVDGVVGIAPVTYPVRQHTKAIPAIAEHGTEHLKCLGYVEGVHPFDKTVYRVRQSFLDDLKHHNVERAVRTIRRSLLIVHGSQDHRVRPADSKRVMCGQENEIHRLAMIRGANHYFHPVAHRRALTKTVAQWMKDMTLYGGRDPDFVNGIVVHKGRILLMKRSKKVNAYQGYWHVPAGRVLSGTSPRQQALQEIKEETGLNSRDVRFVQSFPKVRKWLPRFRRNVSVHQILYEARTNVVTLDWEHDRYRWVIPEQALRMKILPHMDRSYRMIQQRTR